MRAVEMEYDVVVVGAGPVGLMLACELRLAGVRVLVVERRPEPDTRIKAGSINMPTAEAFDRRGVLPELEEAQRRALQALSVAMRRSLARRPSRPAPPRIAGHFAGIVLSPDRLDAPDADLAGRGPAADVHVVPQEEIERVLAQRAALLGVEVRRGVELTGLRAGGTGVTALLAGDEARAAWLVGCDGAGSAVRQLAGFDFPGTDAEITGYQAIVEMEGDDALARTWARTEAGTYLHGPMPGRLLVLEFGAGPAGPEEPVAVDEFEASLRRVSGTDVRVTRLVSAVRFTDAARQAPAYRLGRVLLAGDAAHVHAPLGGHGLNLGIGDAVNLGWKLAAEVRGWAPSGLLDSYTAERHPAGARVLDWTRAQVAVMRPGPHARALRAVVGDLLETVAGTTYVVRRNAGAGQRYDLGGGHPLVGASAPDLALADGRRLAEHLHDGRTLLVDLAGDAALRAVADGYRGRLHVVTGRCPERLELAGLLVRPDGVVAWAASASGEPRGLDASLRRWLGPPGPAD
jgi:2-polyprenyl-6-methoxyphenol hydroxylase-like FAD-dependent oxidoreductase